jgi:hypothetical protein
VLEIDKVEQLADRAWLRHDWFRVPWLGCGKQELAVIGCSLVHTSQDRGFIMACANQHDLRVEKTGATCRTARRAFEFCMEGW